MNCVNIKVTDTRGCNNLRRETFRSKSLCYLFLQAVMTSKNSGLFLCSSCSVINTTLLFWLRFCFLVIYLGLLPWVKLVDNFDAQYSYITNEGTVFTFHSNLDAPRYCLINIDIQKPERQHWTTLLPQHDKDVLGKTTSECIQKRTTSALLHSSSHPQKKCNVCQRFSL